MPKEARFNPAPMQKIFESMPVRLSKRSIVTVPKYNKVQTMSTVKESSIKPTLEKQLLKYDVVSEFANASTGLSIGQLWQGDAVKAQKELRKYYDL